MTAHGDAYLCQNPACQQELGRIYQVAEGLFALQVGGVLIREGHSMFCANCGQPVHWSMSDQKLAKLIKDQLALRLQEQETAP